MNIDTSKKLRKWVVNKWDGDQLEASFLVPTWRNEDKVQTKKPGKAADELILTVSVVCDCTSFQCGLSRGREATDGPKEIAQLRK